MSFLTKALHRLTGSSSETTTRPAEPSSSFKDLGLDERLLKVLAQQGYDQPTPIQIKAIPIVLAKHDLIGCAQTGTGKTAAFALPILQNLMKQQTIPEAYQGPEVLVLSPTRELAIQIHESFCVYGRNSGIRAEVIYGGVGQKAQVDGLRKNSPLVLVATPGRLLDLIQQRLVNLRNIRVFVLDEADRMLDMGFIHDVRKVVQLLPRQRQTLMFSATMPPDIERLANQILHQPLRVAVNPVSSASQTVEQKVYMVGRSAKRDLLVHLLSDESVTRMIVFTRTKSLANRVADHLGKNNIKNKAIHADKSQNARQAALEGFKRGTLRVLVATDIAARGIDVDDISHVVNFDLPEVPETYVHRIGRTGRASRTGIAYSFCDQDQRHLLADIEKHLKKKIERCEDHPYVNTASEAPTKPQPRGQGRGSNHENMGGRGRRPGRHQGNHHSRGDAPRHSDEVRGQQGHKDSAPSSHHRSEGRQGTGRRGHSNRGRR